MFKEKRTIQGFGLALLAVLTLSSCTDEEVIFRRVVFDEVPAEAMGFLGYSDSETKLTVCGNCHVGQQSKWEETGHADAWDGLQQSPGAQEFCESCHTVNELGNTLTEVAGHNAFPDERYYDVQCESCHGPGELHVENPDAAANHPEAPIAVGDLDDLSAGCAECHSGAHHPFAENWADSPHSGLIGFAAARDGCNSCHEGKGALEAFGVNSSFLEEDTDDLFPITCAVCHDPHSANNEGQLRFSVATANLEENLCARCHNRRTAPDPSSSHGLEPHAPSAALLLGDAGWFPPGAEIDQGQIIASHGSDRNERLCATCHVASFEVTDPDTQGFLETATGHLFTAIPCVDENGIPVEGDCGLSVDERSFAGCTGAGCHSENGALSAVFVKAGDIQDLAEELHDLLIQVDPNLAEPGGEIDATNPTFTLAEGAFFNFAMAEFGGPDREGRLPYVSAATHNPFLVPELLRASIALVEEEYGVTASPEAAAPAHLKTGEYKTLILPGKTQ